jgi:hypothetical protein
MPKRYKPELDFEPLGWGRVGEGDVDTDIENLATTLQEAADLLVAKLEECGTNLEEDDREEFLTDLELFLIRFVADCRAHPLRTSNQLLPTVREIRRDPEKFFREMNSYSPEAIALVYQEYQKAFPGDPELLRWEAAGDQHTPAANIKMAAKAATVMLRGEAKLQGRGRLPLKRVEQLAVDLGRLFLNHGGRLGRSHDFLTGEERGPFRGFLEIIASLVSPLVRRTGHHLNCDTMVRRAQGKLLPKGQGRKKPPI